MSDRIDVTVLGYKIGTAADWENDDGVGSPGCYIYRDFEPVHGLGLGDADGCDIYIDYVKGELRIITGSIFEDWEGPWYLKSVIQRVKGYVP